jgi:hypothetical protein
MFSTTTAAQRGSRAPRPGGRRFSSVLRRLADEVEDRIRLSDLSRAFGDRVFGAVLLVFALPNLLPLPPGISTVLGIPLILISAQLALGRPELWLPQAVGERSLGKGDLQRIVDYGSGPLRRTERLLAPRWSVLLSDRWIGVACLVLAVVLILPIPLGNIPPAFAICAFALGLLQRDGVAVLLGWIATAGSLVIVAFVSGAAIYAAKAAIDAAVSLLGG